MTLHPFLSPVGMRCGSRVGTAILRCRAELQNLANWCTKFHNPPCMALPCCPPFAQGGLFFGPVPQKRLVVSAWPRQGPRREAGKRSGSSVTLHPYFLRLCWLFFPGKESMTAQALGPAAASPDGLQVILALCQNNTPPTPEIPFRISGGLPRREGYGPLGMSFPFSGNTVCNKKREEHECREKWRSAASTHPNCRL